MECKFVKLLDSMNGFGSSGSYVKYSVIRWLIERVSLAVALITQDTGSKVESWFSRKHEK